jgi:hypothetical protein
MNARGLNLCDYQIDRAMGLEGSLDYGSICTLYHFELKAVECED